MKRATPVHSTEPHVAGHTLIWGGVGRQGGAAGPLVSEENASDLCGQGDMARLQCEMTCAGRRSGWSYHSAARWKLSCASSARID